MSAFHREKIGQLKMEHISPSGKSAEIHLTSNLEQKGPFCSFPLDVLCKISDPLSIYDSGRLAGTSRFMYRASFSLALLPECRAGLEQKPAQYDGGFEYIFVLARSILNFGAMQAETIDQQKFTSCVESRKFKYWVRDEKGMACLKQLGLDSPLIKEKIASGERTQKGLLAGKDVVKRIITEQLKGGLTEQVRRNLESKIIQECLLAKFLSLSEAGNLSEKAVTCLENMGPHLLKMLGKNQITKEMFLNFNDDILIALTNRQVQTALYEKNLTLEEVVNYPEQVLALFTNSVLSDAVSSNEITRQDVFGMKESHLNVIHLNEITNLIRSKRLKVSEFLTWDENSAKLKVMHINWVISFLADIGNTSRHYQNDMCLLLLNGADLLFEIEIKLRDKEVNGIPYFANIWGKQLTVLHLLKAPPETIRFVLFEGLDKQLAYLVGASDPFAHLDDGRAITIDGLMELSPAKIAMLCNKSVRWALDKKLLTAWDIHHCSAEELLNKANQRISEHSEKS